MTEKIYSKSIVFLRPQTKQAITVLDNNNNNKKFTRIIISLPELCDTRIKEISERVPTTYLSPYINYKSENSLSRESTPGLYFIYPRVLWLGFNTEIIHTAYGYCFGSLSDCDVHMAYYNRLSQECYFRIHYNFNSGALLITAMC